MRAYRAAWLRSDLPAGVTVAAVILPIAMAYGQLSGLPAIAGVYASLLPLAAYALFGSSRQLILGPDASTTALMATTVAPLAAGNPARYAALAGALALMVGLFCIAAGLARLGFLADFLSKPILVGYINGLALTIIASQLSKVFGVPIRSGDFFGQLAEFAAKLGRLHWPTLATGASVLAVVLLLRRAAPRVPGALIAVVGATAAAAVFHLDAYGVSTVGAIRPGLPSLTLPIVAVGDLGPLASSALGIALVIFSDTILNGRTFARRNGYTINAQRELVALGAANAAAGLSQGFPVSASGARTAVNEAVGGKTQLVGVVAALALVAILLFLTAPLSMFPTAALGAVLIAAVLGLLDFATLRQLYRVRKREFVIALVAMLGVLILGLLQGILLPIALSLALLLARAARPHDAVLRLVEGLDGFHDIGDYPEGETTPGLIVYRYDAPLFFANAEHFRARVRGLVAGAESPVEWFLVDAEAITDVDATAAEMLEGLRGELASHGVVLAMARVKQPVRAIMARAGLVDAIGKPRFFPSIRSGVAAFARRSRGSEG